MKQEYKKISTPIADFVRAYGKSEGIRLHMPGHKGKSVIGCESWDITEIYGADSLYEADGIIAESEENASRLFGSGRTLFSTEGSSQCIRAMLYLAALYGREKKVQRKRPVIAAARNVHKTFIYAATLLDFDVIWLWPENQRFSICSCYISPKQVENVLKEHPEICAVYVTSPDYLGGQADIPEISKVCHKNDVILAVDNAHGAYLKFLEPSQHPMDLGADICCDSAHKTLPVLTGGAYLHISKNAPELFKTQAKNAMSLFGSTSPSYLIMNSLDMCNEYLSGDYPAQLKNMLILRDFYCEKLQSAGWKVIKSDPLKITLEIPGGSSGFEVANRLRDGRIECEYADQNYIVFMLTPQNTKQDLECLISILGENTKPYQEREQLPLYPTEQMMTIREAMFSIPETIEVSDAEGRISRVPTVSRPPAIPVSVPGELITKELISIFQYYGIAQLDVVKEK